MATRNARVQVLAALKRIGRRYRFLSGSRRWGQSQTVYELDARPCWRKRNDDEKIELNLRAWFELRAELACMADDLVSMDTLAVQEIQRLRAQARETVGAE